MCKPAVADLYSVGLRVDAVHSNERVVLDGRDGRPDTAVGLPVRCVPRVHP